MFKKSLITVIFFIVAYQFYLFYNESKDIKQETQDDEIYNEVPEIEEVPERKPMVYETPQSFEHPVLGKPTKIIPEGYLFIIENPQPWNAIVFNQSKEQKYLFIIKIPKNFGRINQIVASWSQIIKGIQINEMNELVIPSVDENSALAILNLMLNNIKGDLSLENIQKNNLIGISIAKIRNYSSIRSKIIEQIMESLSGKSESVEGVEYEEDLAETANEEEFDERPLSKRLIHGETRKQNKESFDNDLMEVNKITPQYNSNEPIPYEGNEYSYV
jgi:hypothetical protein